MGLVRQVWWMGVLGWMACSQWQGIRVTGRSILPCPEQTLTAEAAAELGREAVVVVDAKRLGEHHHLGSLHAGLPMLKQAALQGDVASMSRYASLVLWYGFIDTDGKRFLGRTPRQNAKEGLLFTVLAGHLGESVGADDEEVFRVLLDPTVPYPASFFEDGSGIAWLLNGRKPADVDPVRQQAYRWKDCWGERS
jgi:hypothetical protein